MCLPVLMFIPSSPPQVPHLDARKIGGKPVLLFGPVAGFSPRHGCCFFAAKTIEEGKKPSNGGVQEVMILMGIPKNNQFQN